MTQRWDRNLQERKGGQTIMKRTLFLLATLTLAFMLSSCVALLMGKDWDFCNRSSYAVTVTLDWGVLSDYTFTLQPGEDKTTHTTLADHVDYSYTPSDLVSSGGDYQHSYYFWDKGSARPF
jgi:hypothetical protein